jgi:protein-S-isoprenylcysteine O-methyltransferase Ste14
MSIDRIDTLSSVFTFLNSGNKKLGVRLVVLDLSERVIICGIYSIFCWKMLNNYSPSADISNVLIVLSEALPLLFVVFRAPSSSLSQRPGDWAIAIVATIAPLCARPDLNSSGPIGPAWLAYVIMLSGLSMQVAAKVILGRRFGIVPANRGVRVLGPYRLVRHPMYAGYTLTHIGFLIAMPSLSNAVVYIVALIFQLMRIRREERILMQDLAYVSFAQRVRYRILPLVF